MERGMKKIATHFQVLGLISAALYPYDILRFVIKEQYFSVFAQALF